MPARFPLLALALVTLLGAAASAQTPTLAVTTPVTLDAATFAHGAFTHDARAAALLDAWVAGDLAPLVAAVAPARRADAWRDFAAFRRVTVLGHGDAVGAWVLGTAETADGGRATTARIAFADGSETVVLRWSGDTLVTMVRGAARTGGGIEGVAASVGL